MTTIVDASVAAKWLLDEDGSQAALRLRAPKYELVCPDLLFLEVGNVLWRKVRAGEIKESDGRAMVAAILEAPVHVESAAALLPAGWRSRGGTIGACTMGSTWRWRSRSTRSSSPPTAA